MTYNASIRDIPMPVRIKELPVSEKGFPVPWFVARINGIPDFRVADQQRLGEAIRHRRCWVCGQKMGRFMAFVLGPMCIINRTISEPPSHRDCAIFSATACPFLANPRMRRRENGLPEERVEPPGIGIKRNPGAIAVWVTESYQTFDAHDGSGMLFTFDDPVEVLWFAEGRKALRSEADESIASGYPLLLAEAQKDGAAAVAELNRTANLVERYLPAPTMAGVPCGAL
jgi:hypothetical protein